MHFMMTWKPADNDASLAPPPAGLITDMDDLLAEAFRTGKIVLTGGMMPLSSGGVVRLAGGKVAVTDGPFVETKELIGGYCIIDVASREEAMAMALDFVNLHQKYGYEGEAEVRRLMGPDEFDPSQPG